ncbi:hypothetical protein RND71_035768 [Anisodus tanguticus]|uniref:Uncharacterized protein n=1 Tax=Anisodus tanguticus TaxID=243964 RepID=A0AAE1UW51_9SOLA|nr:hypothetical protein RND71_035768 [Anisodus tanguticus]
MREIHRQENPTFNLYMQQAWRVRKYNEHKIIDMRGPHTRGRKRLFALYTSQAFYVMLEGLTDILVVTRSRRPSGYVLEFPLSARKSAHS